MRLYTCITEYQQVSQQKVVRNAVLERKFPQHIFFECPDCSRLFLSDVCLMKSVLLIEFAFAHQFQSSCKYFHMHVRI